MVDKKHLKIGIAVFAIAALVIGLSVGLTQKSNKSTNNASSSQAYSMYDVDFDAADCAVVSGYGKSGKSSSESGSSKSGKSSYDRRALYVPGTEDAEASAGIRRKLRDELLQRGLGSKSSKSYKAGKGASSAGGKSGKAACYCVDGKSESSGKSSKSESSGKSGKSEGYDASATYDYSSKSSKSESDPGPDSSKSGKSDSAGTSSGCGKSEKSGGGYGDCSSPKSGKSAPTVGLTCSQGEPPEPTETFSTPPVTGTFSTTPIIPDEFIPSPSPTEGGTTTVATEKDAPEDTQGDRPFD